MTKIKRRRKKDSPVMNFIIGAVLIIFGFVRISLSIWAALLSWGLGGFMIWTAFNDKDSTTDTVSGSSCMGGVDLIDDDDSDDDFDDDFDFDGD